MNGTVQGKILDETDKPYAMEAFWLVSVREVSWGDRLAVRFADGRVECAAGEVKEERP